MFDRKAPFAHTRSEFPTVLNPEIFDGPNGLNYSVSLGFEPAKLIRVPAFFHWRTHQAGRPLQTLYELSFKLQKPNFL